MDQVNTLPQSDLDLAAQVTWLLILSLPVASVSWTMTHEEVLREWRDWCEDRRRQSRNMISRKFFYVFSCEYCLSHYVAAVTVGLFHFRLLLDDWRGFAVSLFAVVAIANVYMSLFARLRVEIKSERLETEVKEDAVAAMGRAPGDQRKSS